MASEKLETYNGYTILKRSEFTRTVLEARKNRSVECIREVPFNSTSSEEEALSQLKDEIDTY